MHLPCTFLFGATLAISLPAGAHTEKYFDSKESVHGGQTRMAGPYHLELVAKDNETLLYVMGHADREFSTEGGAGKANVQNSNKGKTAVKLEPARGNMLKGSADFKLTPETVITIFVELPGQEPTTAAHFAPLKSKAKAAGHGITPNRAFSLGEARQLF